MSGNLESDKYSGKGIPVDNKPTVAVFLYKETGPDFLGLMETILNDRHDARCIGIQSEDIRVERVKLPDIIQRYNPRLCLHELPAFKANLRLFRELYTSEELSDLPHVIATTHKNLVDGYLERYRFSADVFAEPFDIDDVNAIVDKYLPVVHSN